jgi:hypothetical protein
MGHVGAQYKLISCSLLFKSVFHCEVREMRECIAGFFLDSIQGTTAAESHIEEYGKAIATKTFLLPL